MLVNCFHQKYTVESLEVLTNVPAYKYVRQFVKSVINSSMGEYAWQLIFLSLARQKQ